MFKPVIAAIPHYNQPKALSGLAATLVGQGYDGAVVLDDASAPELRAQAQEVAADYNLNFIAGDENRGPAGNRNRIIEDPTKYRHTVIHFLDSDVTLQSEDTADRVRDEPGQDGMAWGGGLIVNPDGTPIAWNYGPSYTMKSTIGSWATLALAKRARTSPESAHRWHKRLSFLVGGYPDTTDMRRSRPFWVAKANMFIESELLRGIGGLPNIRMHDIQGPAIALARKGHRPVFTPEIIVRHNSRKALSGQQRHALQAARYMLGQYGIRRFLFGGDNAT